MRAPASFTAPLTKINVFHVFLMLFPTVNISFSLPHLANLHAIAVTMIITLKLHSNLCRGACHVGDKPKLQPCKVAINQAWHVKIVALCSSSWDNQLKIDESCKLQRCICHFNFQKPCRQANVHPFIQGTCSNAERLQCWPEEGLDFITCRNTQNEIATLIEEAEQPSTQDYLTKFACFLENTCNQKRLCTRTDGLLNTSNPPAPVQKEHVFL